MELEFYFHLQKQKKQAIVWLAGNLVLTTGLKT